MRRLQRMIAVTRIHKRTMRALNKTFKKRRSFGLCRAFSRRSSLDHRSRSTPARAGSRPLRGSGAARREEEVGIILRQVRFCVRMSPTGATARTGTTVAPTGHGIGGTPTEAWCQNRWCRELCSRVNRWRDVCNRSWRGRTQLSTSQPKRCIRNCWNVGCEHFWWSVLHLLSNSTQANRL